MNPSNTANASTSATASLQARSLQVSLTVKDLQTSLAWYTDALGFAVRQKHEHMGALRAVSLIAGEVQVLINQDDGARGLDRAKGEGFSFQLTVAESVDDVANRIKAAGGVLMTEPADMPWGVRAFRVQDPDGFRIVISSMK